MNATHICIVLDYATEGSLLDLVNKHGKLNEDWARYYLQQLVAGLIYCHRQV
jgi:5'-AMP-activated protein kinase catalytic alpha subunit